MNALSNLYKNVIVFMLIALAGVQSSCGFHLRGVVGLPDHITPVFLDLSGSDDVLGRELQNLLSSSGENVLAASGAEAKTVLTISGVKKKQRVVVVDDLGRAREYELNYKFSYELKKTVAAGEPIQIIKTNTVKLKKDWLFDPDSVLAVGHERDALYGDMRKGAARALLRQLSTIKAAASPQE